MYTYETVIVVHPRLSDPEIADFADKTKLMITKDGGEILSEDRWGRRKLAYPIRKSREGYYIYMKYKAKGSLVMKMGQQFRIQDHILRALTVHAHKAKSNGAKSKPKPKKIQATT
ncbi:30S ribosomal protein S6 [Elusimicrobiota bacterium]